MNELRYTLVTEGSSDRALMPILEWALRENGINGAIQGDWADLRWTQSLDNSILVVKIQEALRLYPCDLLFVHRDADRASRQKRVDEIETALAKTVSSDSSIGQNSIPPSVCVVPVRMQEAWLLFDEMSIRYAAGNRNGRVSLQLPALNQLETLPDPKQVLHELLKKASEKTGRRLKKFRPHAHAWRVSNFIEEFSPLRELSAFASMEEELAQIIETVGWHS